MYGVAPTCCGEPYFTPADVVVYDLRFPSRAMSDQDTAAVRDLLLMLTGRQNRDTARLMLENADLKRQRRAA